MSSEYDDGPPELGSFRRPSRASSAETPDRSFLARLVGAKNPPNTRVSESLDYEPIQNKVFYNSIREHHEKRNFYGYTGHSFTKMFITVLTGVVTGMCAASVEFSVNWLTIQKLDKIQDTIGDGSTRLVVHAYLWNMGFSFGLVILATAMVQYWAPASAGAGVTLVMAYLNGNHIPNLLRFRTLMTKLLGTICSVASGMPMGPEGPMVHIGAAVASVITYIDHRVFSNCNLLACCGHQDDSTYIKEKLRVLDEIMGDTDHRELISAGTASGISAAFAAPIGGVLFAMEEACSFWSRKTAWRCFIAAVCATFTMSQIIQSAQHGMLSFEGLRSIENKDWLMQLPFIIINAAVAGLLGAAFNSLRMFLWRVRAAKTRHLMRIAEVVLVAFASVTAGFFFAMMLGTCIPTNKDEWSDGYGVRFTCPEGHHNDMATLFLSSHHTTISKLFSMGHDTDTKDSYLPHFSKTALLAFLAMFLTLMGAGAGLAIPGGLFMPSALVGATWGALWGSLLREWLPEWNIQPGVYAMMAAAGVLGGVFRSAISLVVLVVEGTHSIEYMFGVIIAVVIANLVAHWIHHDGVYESELERMGNVYFLRDEPPHRLHTLTAEQIMGTGVYGFKAIENVSKIMEVLRTTSHNGFPVFEAHPEQEEDIGRLRGLILRHQLLVLLQRRSFCDQIGRPIRDSEDDDEDNQEYEADVEADMRTFYSRYFTHNRYVVATTAPLDALGLDGRAARHLDVGSLYADLRPYMNMCPWTVHRECSASRVHEAFVGLGLRHLLVVDNSNHVVGMITRKDLDHAAGQGWWRMSHQASPPRKARPSRASSIVKRTPVNLFQWGSGEYHWSRGPPLSRSGSGGPSTDSMSRRGSGTLWEREGEGGKDEEEPPALAFVEGLRIAEH